MGQWKLPKENNKKKKLKIDTTQTRVYGKIAYIVESSLDSFVHVLKVADTDFRILGNCY